MKAQELIEENTKKRELLHVPNKVYYEQLMIYIRTKMLLSEQKSEEVLMDMLDHLLEAQSEGKSAEDVFGTNPKAYADEVVEQLPDEEKRDMVKFWGRMAFQLLGYYFVARGIVMIPFSYFQSTPVDDHIYLFPTMIQIAVIMLVVWTAIRLVFSWLGRTAFDEVTTKGRWKEYATAGLLGGLAFLIIGLVNFYLPNFGPSSAFPPSSSIGIGAIFMLVSWILKRTE